MKLKLSLLVLLCPFFCLGRALQIGERMPDIAIHAVLNYGAHTLRFSELRGKVIIIDFWATSCGSCVANLPHLDSLQREFGDRLVIVAVTFERAAVVRKFLGKNPRGQALRLPVVTDDVLLAGLFPHSYISHEVWIDGSGTVAAITEPEYVDSVNISALLRQEMLSLPVKTDLAEFDYRKPLFPGKTGFYADTCSYKAGVLPKLGYVQDTLSHSTRMYVVNTTILWLYLLALRQPVTLPGSRMVIKVRDLSRIFVPAGTYPDAWNRVHSFCYESVRPGLLSPGQERGFLLADIDSVFKLRGRMEQREMPCLSIQKLGPGSKLPVSAGGVSLNTLQTNAATKVLRNYPLAQLAWDLENMPGGLPCFDDTGFSGAVDLELTVASLRDTEALDKALQRYGLALRRVMRPINVFVLTENLYDHE